MSTMNPKLSSKYVYENSTNVFIDGKGIKSTAELVGLDIVIRQSRVLK